MATGDRRRQVVDVLEKILEAQNQMTKNQSAMEKTLSGLVQSHGTMAKTQATMAQSLGRVEQGLNDLGAFMRQIALDQTRHERFHLRHVDLLEKDVSDLKERVSRLEKV
jgi:hypothetical protein